MERKLSRKTFVVHKRILSICQVMVHGAMNIFLSCPEAAILFKGEGGWFVPMEA
jgi:hypothetical protein